MALRGISDCLRHGAGPWSEAVKMMKMRRRDVERWGDQGGECSWPSRPAQAGSQPGTGGT